MAKDDGNRNAKALTQRKRSWSPVNHSLVIAFGDANIVYFLSYLAKQDDYFTDKGTISKDGFFWKFSTAIQRGTGFGEKRILNFTNELEKRGFIETRLGHTNTGQTCKWFKVHMEEILKAIDTGTLPPQKPKGSTALREDRSPSHRGTPPALREDRSPSHEGTPPPSQGDPTALREGPYINETIKRGNNAKHDDESNNETPVFQTGRGGTAAPSFENPGDGPSETNTTPSDQNVTDDIGLMDGEQHTHPVGEGEAAADLDDKDLLATITKAMDTNF